MQVERRDDDLLEPGPVRCGKVPSHGRAPADQAPPPLQMLCDVSQARRVIRPFGGIRGEERGASLNSIRAAASLCRVDFSMTNTDY